MLLKVWYLSAYCKGGSNASQNRFSFLSVNTISNIFHMVKNALYLSYLFKCLHNFCMGTVKYNVRQQKQSSVLKNKNNNKKTFKLKQMHCN